MKRGCKGLCLSARALCTGAFSACLKVPLGRGRCIETGNDSLADLA